MTVNADALTGGNVKEELKLEKGITRTLGWLIRIIRRKAREDMEHCLLF